MPLLASFDIVVYLEILIFDASKNVKTCVRIIPSKGQGFWDGAEDEAPDSGERNTKSRNTKSRNEESRNAESRMGEEGTGGVLPER